MGTVQHLSPPRTSFVSRIGRRLRLLFAPRRCSVHHLDFERRRRRGGPYRRAALTE